jgi:hypothetical protein
MEKIPALSQKKTPAWIGLNFKQKTIYKQTFHSTLFLGKALPALSQKTTPAWIGLRAKKQEKTITLCGVWTHVLL